MTCYPSLMRYEGASVEILKQISMPCPSGDHREIFQGGEAFLCHYKGLPVENGNGTIETYISGYAVTGDPWEKLKQWTRFPLQKDGGWDDTDLFYETKEQAIEAKIKDLQAIWEWTSLKTVCQSCTARGERCKNHLASLKNSSFSFL